MDTKSITCNKCSRQTNIPDVTSRIEDREYYRFDCSKCGVTYYIPADRATPYVTSQLPHAVSTRNRGLLDSILGVVGLIAFSVVVASGIVWFFMSLRTDGITTEQLVESQERRVRRVEAEEDTHLQRLAVKVSLKDDDYVKIREYRDRVETEKALLSKYRGGYKGGWGVWSYITSAIVAIITGIVISFIILDYHDRISKMRTAKSN